MEQKQRDETTGKVVILHGFSNEQIFAILKAVKREMQGAEDIAFATTTAHSLQMRLQDVISDVTQEHAYMKENPPGQTPTEA